MYVSYYFKTYIETVLNGILPHTYTQNTISAVGISAVHADLKRIMRYGGWCQLPISELWYVLMRVYGIYVSKQN